MYNRYNSNSRPVLDLDAIHRRAPSVFATHAHSSASEKYTFIPSTTILTSLLSNGWKCVEANEMRCRRADKFGFQKHALRFTRDDLILSDGSSVDLSWNNSHDLSQASIMSLAFWRKVCSNGLHVSSDLVEPIRVKHIGSKAEDFIEASFRLINEVPKLTNSVKEMQQVNLNADERRYYAGAAIIAKYGLPESGKALPLVPDKALQPRRACDQATDLWTTFNVVQENLIQGGQRSYASGRRKTTRGVTSIGENTKLNQALWSLAENMKQLKTA